MDDDREVKSYPGEDGDYSTIFSSKGDPDDDDKHGHVVVDKDGDMKFDREEDEED